MVNCRDFFGLRAKIKEPIFVNNSVFFKKQSVFKKQFWCYFSISLSLRPTIVPQIYIKRCSFSKRVITIFGAWSVKIILRFEISLYISRFASTRLVWDYIVHFGKFETTLCILDLLGKISDTTSFLAENVSQHQVKIHLYIWSDYNSFVYLIICLTKIFFVKTPPKFEIFLHFLWFFKKNTCWKKKVLLE